MVQDPELIQHKEWLGFLQPVGLVVSPPALLKFQCVPSRNVVELQQTFQQYIIANSDKSQALIADFSAFAVGVLGWEPEDLIADIPPEFTLPLPEYGETLQPNFLVFDPDTNRPCLLIQILENYRPLDEADPAGEKSGGWNVSPQAKFERLLRETGVFVGLLSNNSQLRLVYAPRGESSGYLTFPVAAMGEVAARPILAALEMLLNSTRLFVLPIDRRLTALLQESRKYQSEVSTKLAQQVLDALWELLRGFQIADAAVGGKLLGEISRTNPQHIYGGLIATLMRLVFLLYAEDEGLMPQDAVYARNYAVTGLYERLQVDAGNYPDTMDRRYGAWAWLLSLFRLVYDGGGHLPHYLPARRGQLFDPIEYPFLMGFAGENSEVNLPQLPDSTIFQVLNKLLILDGERLSYRSLDVEQIGSVYEAIMGFSVEVVAGVSIALRPKDVVVNLAEILAAKTVDRPKLLKELAGCEVSGKSLTDLKAAKTIDGIIIALKNKISPRTPDALPACSLYLQPGEERRRSGSHYTPRSLTEPLVKITLQPILAALGNSPTEADILGLKVCDPAMGSGAFLVETCRQLAEELVKVWTKTGVLQARVNDGEEPLIKARRLVAQRCLYGVDKNPFAVSLAKLSLWLVTLAKDYPFTFIDGALKCGDSLVGLTRQEIGEFVKVADIHEGALLSLLKNPVDKAKVYRDEIEKLDDFQDDRKREIFKLAESELQKTRLTGNVAIASFFAADKDKERKEKRVEFSQQVNEWIANPVKIEKVASIAGSLQQLAKPILPFNWEIEFPEVFDRPNPGFDAIVGNPPFAGKNTTINANAPGYLDWLKVVHPESHGNADLVAHFFRRAFTILRQNGCFGLIATNTIAQGDTRSTGLRYICENGGTIYHAEKRFKWPGLAAVVVSVVNVQKVRAGLNKTLDSPPISLAMRPQLDGREVAKISAFLFHAGGNDNPKVLLANAGKSFQGSNVLGRGFTFDDTKPEATPIAEMHRLIAENPKNQERIFPYIGGEEVNDSPTHSHHRYVINFGDMSESEAREYPDLMGIVEEKVKPARLKQNREIRARYWWRFGENTPALFKEVAKCNRVLVCCIVSKYLSFAFLPTGMVYSHKLNIFTLRNYAEFTIIQSRIHEIWAIFFSSSLEDRLNYSPSDCFETFPFPSNWETNKELEEIGKTYYEYRAEIMVRNNEGLTATYNRFHDPDEKAADIVKLRQLHEEVDRTVLAAYGWQDIATKCEFILDYEEAETEETPNKRQKKKPWRYRWPEEIHDEVLARLLELNSQRHLEETLGGKAAEGNGKSKGGKGKTGRKKQVKNEEPMLFNIDEILQ